MSGSFRVVAIVAAYNEEDVIAACLEDLIGQGVEVHLLDDGSSDDTVAEARRLLGRGVVAIESLPAPDGPRYFSLARILRRKEELARELDADWLINHDADEFRLGPWPDVGLRDALERVDRAGWNAVDFALFDFRPTGESFRRGQDPRAVFRHWQPAAAHDRLQVRAWKRAEGPLDLVTSGGHDSVFPGRRVCPVRFLLRHYPLRGEEHARRKLERDRLPRYDPGEVERGWHRQYRGGAAERLEWAPGELRVWDENEARLAAELDPALGAAAGTAELGGASEAVALERQCARLGQELDAALRERERLSRELDARNRECDRLGRTLHARNLDLKQAAVELDARNRELLALRAAKPEGEP